MVHSLTEQGDRFGTQIVIVAKPGPFRNRPALNILKACTHPLNTSIPVLVARDDLLRDRDDGTFRGDMGNLRHRLRIVWRERERRPARLSGWSKPGPGSAWTRWDRGRFRSQ